MKDILPLLLLLACPLMMIFMMRGMHGGGHSRAAETHPDDLSAAELRRLRDESDQRLQALDERVQHVEAVTDVRRDDAVCS
jgi:hypothetical protein